MDFKSNQEIDDYLALNKMEWHVKEHLGKAWYFNKHNQVVMPVKHWCPRIKIDQAFILADKIGLLHDYFLWQSADKNWVICNLDGIAFSGFHNIPSEAICMTIVQI